MPFVTLRAPDTAAPAARFAALNGFQLFSALFTVSLEAGVTRVEDCEELLPAWAEVRVMTKTTMTAALIAVATLYWERMTMLLNMETFMPRAMTRSQYDTNPVHLRS